MKRFTRLNDLARTALTAAALSLVAAGGAEAGGPGVHGRVFALDENGTLTGAVPGARIEIHGQGGGRISALTAMRGGYYRAELPPGQYLYKITADGFKDEDSGRGFVLQLTEGYAVYNFSLIRGKTDPDRKPPEQPDAKIGKLEGRVLEKKPDGELIGVGRARIALRRDDGGRGLSRVITRGSGKKPGEIGQYEIALEAGVFRASVRAEGFKTLLDPEPIRVALDRTTSRDFILTREKPEQPVQPVKPEAVPLVFRGAVYETLPNGQGKRPLPGASVLLRGAGQALAAAPRNTTDRAGKVELSVAKPGTYTVLARKTGYKPAGGAVNIVPGGENTKNILLVKLQQQTSVPPVVPPRDRRTPVAPIVPPQTNPQPAVPPIVQPEVAVLNLRVRPDAQRQPTDRVRPSTVVLSLEVTGVRAKGGKTFQMPLPGAQIKVLQNGRLATSGQSDRLGRFSTRLQPGAYQIYVAHQGFSPHRGSVNLAGPGVSRRIVLKGRMHDSQGSGNKPGKLPDMRSTIRPPLRSTHQQTPQSTPPSSMFRSWQQMSRGPSPSAAPAGRTQQNGRSSHAGVNRMSVDPRQLNSASTLKQTQSLVPYGRGPSRRTITKAERLKSLQTFTRSSQAADK